MSERPARDEASAGGHYVTAGAAITGLGVFGLAVAIALSFTFDIHLGFIDARAMATACLVFIATGVWMMRTGRIAP